MQGKQIINNIDVENCMYYKCREEVDLTNHDISHVNECHCYGDICERHPNCYYKKCKALEDIVKKLKPILEFYANSTIGVEQENGTYILNIQNYNLNTQNYNIKYNPNPAKYGVKLIEETLDE